MAENTIPYKIYLTEEEMPKAWYNLRADMKNKPAPLLNPGTGKPLSAEELAPIFCEELVKQELDETTPFIEIPVYVLTALRRSSELRLRSTTSSKETTQAEATNSTPLSLRHTTLRSRASRVLPQRPVQVSGELLFQWHVLISDLTVRYSWLRFHMSRSLSAVKLCVHTEHPLYLHLQRPQK